MWSDLLHNYQIFCKISLKFVKEIWSYCIYIKLSIFWVFTILPKLFEHVHVAFDHFSKSFTWKDLFLCQWNEVLSPQPKYLIIKKGILMCYIKRVYKEEYLWRLILFLIHTYHTSSRLSCILKENFQKPTHLIFHFFCLYIFVEVN